MNDDKLNRMLELATGQRPALPSANSTQEIAELRAAWDRLSVELAAHDEQLDADSSEFLSRLKQTVLAQESECTAEVVAHKSVNSQRAAIVASGRHADEPVGWRGWLALVACVAICGSAILWYDFDPQGGASSQVVTLPATQENGVRSASSPSERSAESMQPVVTPPDQAAAAGSYIAWTDPVDAAIAEANSQLASLQNTSRWDRSLEALEQYRESVEQEMNEWDL